MTKQTLTNFLDSQDFYELMQAYRHTPLDAAKEYEAVRVALYAAIAQPEQPASEHFPFYELKFILRVLGHKGTAPREDWETAYGMAKAVFTDWHKVQIEGDAKDAEVDALVQKLQTAQFMSDMPFKERTTLEIKAFLSSRAAIEAEQGKRQPLTDERLYEMYNEPTSDAEMIAFARAIEAVHGITATPQGNP